VLQNICKAPNLRFQPIASLAARRLKRVPLGGTVAVGVPEAT